MVLPAISVTLLTVPLLAVKFLVLPSPTVKLPVVRPITSSLKVTLKLMLVLVTPFVVSETAVTVGATVSMFWLPPFAAKFSVVAALGLPAISWTALPTRLSSTVPLATPVFGTTTTVYTLVAPAFSSTLSTRPLVAVNALVGGRLERASLKVT